MRILLYGGSFNPPHLGHEDALRAAREALQPDKTLVIPAGIPPHKALAEGSPSAEDRLRMTELAFADAPGAQVTDLELRRQGKSYTVDTLRQLHARWPEAELCFLVGTDMLLYMEQWMSFREIFTLCTLAAMPREEGELPRLESFAPRALSVMLTDAFPELTARRMTAPKPSRVRIGPWPPDFSGCSRTTRFSRNCRP